MLVPWRVCFWHERHEIPPQSIFESAKISSESQPACKIGGFSIIQMARASF